MAPRLTIRQHWMNVTPPSRTYDHYQSAAIKSWMVSSSRWPPLKEGGSDSNCIPTKWPCLSSHLDRSWRNPEQSRLQPESLKKRVDNNWQQTQAKTIEALRRQVEASTNATRDAQALFRPNPDQQQQHLRMPSPCTLPTITGGIISNTPFVQSFATPSAGLRTRELHGLGYYHVGSPNNNICRTHEGRVW